MSHDTLVRVFETKQQMQLVSIYTNVNRGGFGVKHMRSVVAPSTWFGIIGLKGCRGRFPAARLRVGNKQLSTIGRRYAECRGSLPLPPTQAVRYTSTAVTTTASGGFSDVGGCMFKNIINIRHETSLSFVRERGRNPLFRSAFCKIRVLFKYIQQQLVL